MHLPVFENFYLFYMTFLPVFTPSVHLPVFAITANHVLFILANHYLGRKKSHYFFQKSVLLKKIELSLLYNA